MERKEIINNLMSDGALYRCQGIVFAAMENMTDEKTVSLLRNLKKDRVMKLGREVGWYAISALEMLGVEKYGGDEDLVLRFISEFPALVLYIKNQVNAQPLP